MSRSWIARAVLGIGLVVAPGAMGAELAAPAAEALGPIVKAKSPRLSSACWDVPRCGPNGCYSYRICRRSCPDPYSCYPLYGAYGPYGGAQYWGAYTWSGWGYYQ
jgi:hypothetical protein